MSASSENSRRAGSRFLLVFTWLVIAGLVAVMAVMRAGGDEAPARVGDDVLSLRLFRIQARYLVGTRDLVGSNERIDEAAAGLNCGGAAQRLRFIVLAGELANPAEALEQLRRLDRELPGRDQRLRDILRRLYRDYENFRLDAPSVAAADRDYLRRQLGWFGELALAPGEVPVKRELLAAGLGASAALAVDPPQPIDTKARAAVLQPARETLLYFVAGALIFLLLGFIGLAGLTTLAVLASRGMVRGKVDADTGHGTIYGEAMAVFLVLFVALPLVPLPLPALVRSGIFALASVGIALAWARLRGIAWRQVRCDLGLARGRGLLVEAGIGVAGYVMTLPLAALGVLGTYLLMQLRATLTGQPGIPASDYPSHPAMEAFATGGLADRIAIVVLAAGIAPLVEEIAFRGLLYQHLREATGRLGAVISFLLSASLVSFIFAVIHPQGLLAVPPLMALAVGFSILREWRGTLLPSMVGHALNNGLICALLYLLVA